MSQNDWKINASYLNGTPTEGAAELHSNRPNLIPESANAGTYCRQWQIYGGTTSWGGLFIRSKNPELIEIPDTKAVSIRAWMQYSYTSTSDTRCGLIARGVSDSWNVAGGEYHFSYRADNNTFDLDSTWYAAPSGIDFNQGDWFHMRLDVIPIKLNGVTVMDHLRGFIEIDGEWSLIAEKYVEVTDSEYISPSSGKYYGVYHHYFIRSSRSYFFVDKIQIYTESMEHPGNVYIDLVNDTGVSSTDKITSDSTLSIVSSVEDKSVVRYSTDSYNWQDGIPTPVSGANTLYVKQVGYDGKASRPTKFEYTYVPEGPAFSSEATSSVYQGAGADFLIYKTEASSVTDFSYDLKQVDDYADFSISSSSGLVYANNNLDYATKNSYNFTVTATDLAGNTTEKPVLLNVLGEDEHYYDTSLILKMDSDLSCSSAYEQDVTVSGVQLTGSTSKYGGSSAYFDGGTNTGLQIPSSGLLDLRNVDWTMEAWVNPDGDYSDGSVIIAKRNYSNGYDYQIFLWETTGELGFYEEGAGYINSGVAPIANQWNHVAAVRKDGVITLYLNGEAKASETRNIAYHRNVPLGIGNIGELNRYPFKGYIDDVRITKGVARYTEDFLVPGPVPSTGPAPSIVSENLALHLDAGDSGSYSGGDTWYDLTTNNNIFTTSSVSFETENDISFFRFADNAGGHIYQENTAILSNTSDYTFEAWMRFNSTQENQYFMSYAVSGSSSDNELTIGKVLGDRLRIYQNQVSTDHNTAFSNISTGDWFHLVASSEGDSTIIYINGEQVGSSTRTAEQDAIMTSGGTLVFGQEQDSLGGGFDNSQEFVGDISQVRIYNNKGLSDKEVTRNFDFTKSKFGIE